MQHGPAPEQQPTSPAAPWPGSPAPTPKRGGGNGHKVAAWIVGGVVLLALIVCGGCVGLVGLGDDAANKSTGAPAVESSNDDAPATGGATSAAPKPVDDVVKVTKCAMSSNRYLGAEATVSVTNNGTRARSYVVTVAVTSVDGSQQYATINFMFQDVAPRQTAVDKVVALEERSAFPAKFACKITSSDAF